MSVLLNNVGADVVSDVFDLNGGPAILVIRADDFGGGQVTFQVASSNDPDNRFNPIENGSFSNNSTVTLESLPAGMKIRAELSGATAPIKVFAEIKQ